MECLWSWIRWGGLRGPELLVRQLDGAVFGEPDAAGIVNFEDREGTERMVDQRTDIGGPPRVTSWGGLPVVDHAGP